METNEQAENPSPALYKVVINVEEQYSIWPDEKDVPTGWTYAGLRGTKAECLAYIETIWTDIRPLSLQKLMKKQDNE